MFSQALTDNLDTKLLYTRDTKPAAILVANLDRHNKIFCLLAVLCLPFSSPPPEEEVNIKISTTMLALVFGFKTLKNAVVRNYDLFWVVQEFLLLFGFIKILCYFCAILKFSSTIHIVDLTFHFAVFWCHDQVESLSRFGFLAIVLFGGVVTFWSRSCIPTPEYTKEDPTIPCC